MTGEVAATGRQANSMLEEHLDYDTIAKNAPLMTDEVAKKLEDIILQIVKDKAWDDVERKLNLWKILSNPKKAGSGSRKEQAEFSANLRAGIHGSC